MRKCLSSFRQQKPGKHRPPSQLLCLLFRAAHLRDFAEFFSFELGKLEALPSFFLLSSPFRQYQAKCQVLPSFFSPLSTSLHQTRQIHKVCRAPDEKNSVQNQILVAEQEAEITRPAAEDAIIVSSSLDKAQIQLCLALCFMFMLGRIDFCDV